MAATDKLNPGRFATSDGKPVYFGASCEFNHYGVPGNIEGEIKVKVPHAHHFQSIFEAVTSSDDCFFVCGSMIKRHHPLFNMSIDTVDPLSSTPTKKMLKAGFQARKRGSLNIFDKSQPIMINNPEGSFKTLFNDCVGDMHEAARSRLEFEHKLDAYDAPMSHVALMHPSMPQEQRDILMAIQPNEERVQGMAITSRAAYMIGQYMPDHKAIVVYEVCHDDNFFITPHGDTIVLHDLEFEAEVKAVLTKNCAHQMNYTAIVDIMSQSMASIERNILGLNPDYERMRKSKMQRCTDAVGKFYERNPGRYHCTEDFSGLDWALVQGVRPNNHLLEKLSLHEHARQLPSSAKLAPANDGEQATHSVRFNDTIMGELKKEYAIKGISYVPLRLANG